MVEEYIINNNLKIRVKPNSPKTKITGYDKIRKAVLVEVAAPADKNKANLEIIKFFTKLTKKKVEIKKGLKSRDKTLIFS